MQFTEPAQLRQAVRDGAFQVPTAPEAPGYVQTNTIAVADEHAEEFRVFVDRYPKACPLLEVATGRVPIESSEVPMFWACGVTPQLVVDAADLELAITHAPGHMFITDVREEELDLWPFPAGRATT